MQDEENERYFQDLSQLNLDQLDLESIELEETSSPKIGRWVLLITLIALCLFIIFFPDTEYYRYSSNARSYFFGISALAVAIGILGGRWLWTWLEEVTARYDIAQKHHRRPRKQRQYPCPKHTVYLLPGQCDPP